MKAWCYYESRLLGAHHGLLSTYALETMVLYLLNSHHQELNSPLKVSKTHSASRSHTAPGSCSRQSPRTLFSLCPCQTAAAAAADRALSGAQVLHKFLQVFGEFDWDQYCLSLHGPVPLASLQNPSSKARQTPCQATACSLPLPPSAWHALHILSRLVSSASAPSTSCQSCCLLVHSEPSQTSVGLLCRPPACRACQVAGRQPQQQHYIHSPAAVLPLPQHDKLRAGRPVANGHSSPRLPEGFHSQMVSMYSSAPKGASSRPFACKHINIMDPLAASNNLGRSVSKASFLRLRKALNRGALTLGQATAQVCCLAGHPPR